jgi:hypothetical protein
MKRRLPQGQLGAKVPVSFRIRKDLKLKIQAIARASNHDPSYVMAQFLEWQVEDYETGEALGPASEESEDEPRRRAPGNHQHRPPARSPSDKPPKQ